MQTRRQGFTLIELLIVIVIIGILAAIAIPKFGATREKAYFKAMMSDLRNMSAQQEIYYSNSAAYTYTDQESELQLLGFERSQGVTAPTIVADNQGWSAFVSHQAMDPARICAVYHGTAAAVAPANTPGVIACSQ